MFDSILNKIDQFTHWDRLWVTGREKIIQLTILVPLIGYYILFSTEFCDFTNTKIDIGISCTEYPAIKTYLLYFGLSLIGFASVLFSIFCPRLVKLHGTAYEFIDREEGITNERKLADMGDFITKNNSSYPNQELRDFIKLLHQRYEGKRDPKDLRNVRAISIDSEISQKINELQRPLMYDYFELLEETLPKLRRVIFFTYLLGFMFVGLISIITFVQILFEFFPVFIKYLIDLVQGFVSKPT